MKLRARLVVATLAVTLPMLLGLIVAEDISRQRESAADLLEFTQEHQGDSWQSACEVAPESFHGVGGPGSLRPGPGPDLAGPPPGKPPGPPPGPPDARFKPHRRPATFFAYDAQLRSSNPQAPALDPSLLARVGDGASAVLSPYRFQADDVTVLLRGSDGAGPCQYLVAHGTTEPWIGQLLPATQIWLLPLLGVVLSVLVAVGPILQRIRRLTTSVARSADADYAEPIPVEGADEVTGLARAFDAAARKVREQLDERKQREQALRDFLANTTHDVMIPLTVLQGHLASLREQVEAQLPSAAPTLASAMDEAHYLGSLVHNLAIAAKLDSNRAAAQLGQVDLNQLVQRVVARHRPVARQLEIELESAVPVQPTLVQADVTLLEQAVGNVVYNAIRHNQKGGHAAVLLEQLPEQVFRLRVVDDGPGIPEADLERLTQRGFRGSEARTRSPEGQGLGLNITQRVAELHGFDLTLGPSEYGGLQIDLSGRLTLEPDA